MKTTYYSIKSKYWDYKGVRYFKFVPQGESVLMVVVEPGEIKKGRGRSIGIYYIHRNTFLNNYHFMSYVEESSKEEFDIAAENIYYSMLNM